MSNSSMTTAPSQSGYCYSKELDLSFADAVERVKEALKTEGFGVLCEIDVKEKLKEKLGVDFRDYVILGACNPPVAYQTLQAEIDIGLLLPCNVIVYEQEGKAVVNPQLGLAAKQVNEKLRRVVDCL